MVTGEIYRYATSVQAYGALKVPPDCTVNWQCGALVATGLNRAIAEALSNPSHQWVWIMGDDHAYQDMCVLNLLDRGKDVIAPLCLSRVPPLDPFIAIWKGGEKVGVKRLIDLPCATDTPLYKLGDGETCGDAGMLIRRHVLEAIDYPWYETRRTGSLGADDQEFVRRMIAAGYEVWLDLENVLGHTTPITISPIRKETGWSIRLDAGTKRLTDLSMTYPE